MADTKEEFLNRCKNFPNSRNLAKKLRPIRLDKKGNPHVLDYMKGGPDGNNQNTTGCYGTKSTFGIRVKMYGPQSGKRRDKRRKKVSRTPSNEQILRLDRRRLDKLIELRSQILTLQTIGDWSGKPILNEQMQQAFSRISEEIRNSLNQDELIHMYDQERHRDKSLIGRLESEGMRVMKLRKISSRISHAIQGIS